MPISRTLWNVRLCSVFGVLGRPWGKRLQVPIGLRLWEARVVSLWRVAGSLRGVRGREASFVSLPWGGCNALSCPFGTEWLWLPIRCSAMIEVWGARPHLDA